MAGAKIHPMIATLVATEAVGAHSHRTLFKSLVLTVALGDLIGVVWVRTARASPTGARPWRVLRVGSSVHWLAPAGATACVRRAS